jgi:hypothetical protein
MQECSKDCVNKRRGHTARRGKELKRTLGVIDRQEQKGDAIFIIKKMHLK